MLPWVGGKIGIVFAAKGVSTAEVHEHKWKQNRPTEELRILFTSRLSLRATSDRNGVLCTRCLLLPTFKV